MQHELLYADFITHRTVSPLNVNVQEDTMNTHDNTEANARSHLRNNLASSYSKHDHDLLRHFGLMEDDSPDSPEEVIERIKNGKYVLRDKKDRTSFSHWTSHIRWRDPSKEKDEAGYKAAFEKMSQAYKHAQQDVLCDPLDKAKAAVRKFEEYTVH